MVIFKWDRQSVEDMTGLVTASADSRALPASSVSARAATVARLKFYLAKGEGVMQKTVPNPTPQWVLPPVTEGYEYFENCKDNPFRYTSQKFQMINAWWLADA
ncbi:MAG: hypothetical protein ACREAC_00315, partial [Blastocatellia bacterium]